MAHGPSAQGAAQMKELEAGSLNLSGIFRNRFWRVQSLNPKRWTWVLSNYYIFIALSKAVAANALHVRVVWTACTGFLWKPQCKSSQMRVSIKPMQRLLPSPSAVNFFGFGFQASCCTRFCKRQQIPAVQKPNDLSRTNTSRTDPRCRVRCEPGTNSVETVRYRDVPRLRGRPQNPLVFKMEKL